MTYAIAFICAALMVLCLFLIVFGLPGIWGIITLMGLWAWYVGFAHFTTGFFVLLIVLGVVGELVEFAAGFYGAKLYGGSNKGSIGGMVGAIAGAVLCAPLFFGLGALLGALGGAFLGCFLIEKLRNVPTPLAAKAAWGVTLGRMSGFICKISIAIFMLFQCIPAIIRTV